MALFSILGPRFPFIKGIAPAQPVLGTPNYVPPSVGQVSAADYASSTPSPEVGNAANAGSSVLPIVFALAQVEIELQQMMKSMRERRNTQHLQSTQQIAENLQKAQQLLAEAQQQHAATNQVLQQSLQLPFQPRKIEPMQMLEKMYNLENPWSENSFSSNLAQSKKLKNIPKGGIRLSENDEKRVLDIVKRTLPCEDRKYLLLDDYGYLDYDKLKEGMAQKHSYNFEKIFKIANYLNLKAETLVIEIEESLPVMVTKTTTNGKPIIQQIEYDRMGPERGPSVLIIPYEDAILMDGTQGFTRVIKSIEEGVQIKQEGYLHTSIPVRIITETLDKQHHVVVSYDFNWRAEAEMAATLSHELFGHFYRYTINNTPSFWQHKYVEKNGIQIDKNKGLNTDISESVSQTNQVALLECI